MLRFASEELRSVRMRALAAEEHERTRRTLEGLRCRCVGRDGGDLVYGMTGAEWKSSIV